VSCRRLLCVVIMSAVALFTSGSTSAISDRAGFAEQPASDARLPRIRIDRDNIEIRHSCLIEAGAYRVIDSDGNGVLHIVADDITIEFEDGAVLDGSVKGAMPDEYVGTGIRILNHKNVTLRGAVLRGFLCAIHASSVDGLHLDSCHVLDNYGQHLKSTPEAEDEADWLRPHFNDENEWLTRYGAALYIEDSDGITVNRCRVRQSQNGLLLDRVSDSRIFDTDCSFLSGWGLGLWRSNRNVISRNAFDFCVRGYSHGVYIRGQDSAGILMFEQCNDNLIAENSATHGGDCFFGFAGRDALGEAWRDRERKRLEEQGESVEQIEVPEAIVKQHVRLGNNNNLFVGNDFSYGVAHGIELTFSFGNRIFSNRMIENGICGVWGGYSQDTHISSNTFVGNGEMAYGMERGGINIEHGRSNRIEHNIFRNNQCGVYLWWDNDEGLLLTPWGKANERGSSDNTIANNRFDGDVIGVQLRQSTETYLGTNVFHEVVRKDVDTDDPDEVQQVEMPAMMPIMPEYEVLGEMIPFGAREELRGRQNIIMTEWGPWDHESPLLRREKHESAGSRDHFYRLCEAAPIREVEIIVPDRAAFVDNGWEIDWGQNDDIIWKPIEVEEEPGQGIMISCPSEYGVYPYRIRIKAGDDCAMEASGRFVYASWSIRAFPWTYDPRTNLDGWYRQSQWQPAIRCRQGSLQLHYGWDGPTEQFLSHLVVEDVIGVDRFGMIADTELPLTAGLWKITTLSDDGVRVTVDGERVIDNWTHHGPTEDVGTFELAVDTTVSLLVEHFEIDGYAVLKFEIERVGD